MRLRFIFKYLFPIANTVTFPVSVVITERSFSTLKRLKTWLMINMGDEKLTNLVLLNIYKDIAINIVINITS